MEISEQDIRTIVEKVVSSIAVDKDNDQPSPEEQEKIAENQDGVFSTMEQAVDAAEKAQKTFIAMTLEKRREIIHRVRTVLTEHLETMSKLAVEETSFGRWKDKVLKNKLAIEKTPGVEDLEPYSYTDDHGLTLVERAPYGLIGSIVPCTNPTESIIHNGISMIAGGNSVVFNPHPVARRTSNYVIALINSAIREAGGPSNLICTIAEPTVDTAQAMMKHPRIKLLVVTGGPNVVKIAMNSGKKVIAAGPGNPPCVVDETADITKAANNIVNGAGIDNNIICICEKEVLAVHSIIDELKDAMKSSGAYELNKSQIDEVTQLVIADPGRPGHEGAPSKKYVGRDASVIAKEIGLHISEETSILLCEVEADHPLVWTEQLMPVIPIVRMEDADKAINFAVMCEHGFRHTASIHSRNIDNLSKMARVIDCSLFVKNGPNYAGMGLGGAGFTSYTIASPTGEGLTRARTFTRERRCSLIDYFRIV